MKTDASVLSIASEGEKKKSERMSERLVAGVLQQLRLDIYIQVPHSHFSKLSSPFLSHSPHPNHAHFTVAAGIVLLHISPK